MELPISTSTPHSALRFSQLSGELCNQLYERTQDKQRINALVDQLNALNYKSGLFVALHDATTLITALCLNVKPSDSSLAAKATHLLNNLLTRQNLQLNRDTIHRIVAWDISCVKNSSRIVLLDILHNLETALYHAPYTGCQFATDLIGKNGILLSLIEDTDKYLVKMSPQDAKLDIVVHALKCVLSLTAQQDDAKTKEKDVMISSDALQSVTEVVVKFLYKGYNNKYAEFTYCKAVVYALRILSQIYLENHEEVRIPLSEVIGLSKHFILYGLVAVTTPHKITPSQQTISQPVTHNARGGKKQKVRKQRNSAIESLKKEIPVSDRSLTNGFNNFEGEGYTAATNGLVDPTMIKPAILSMTSDSDMSDTEGGRDAKLVALKTRVRQSAANLLMVLIKVTDKKDMFGYWWTLLPDSPNPDAWAEEEATKHSLAYCAVNDPMSVGRSASLSAMLALLSTSRIYLSQAEVCKREISSFTPFSVRLGHTISCMHQVLCSILEAERVTSVVLVALKCCAALVQATPYHRMQMGLISNIVRVTRKYLVHSDVTIQVASLVVTGCILSVHPVVAEVLESVQKDLSASKPKPTLPHLEECDDFEEGYSDDEDIFAAEPKKHEQSGQVVSFSSWVLDICFKNLGWMFRGGKVTDCKQGTIPIMLESLQVISAIAFHHFASLLQPHTKLLADVFASLLESYHAEFVQQTTRTLSSVADAMLKLEQSNPGSTPLTECTYFWEKLLSSPLPTVLQASDNPTAKAVACDCVANVGERVFRELPRRLQLVCVTLLSGTCGDEEAGVRAAAVRAIAMCALYPTLREDLCFVSDCVESILRGVQDPVLAVRVKASWALGNLSDALVLNMQDPEIDNVDDDLLLRLLETSIHCATENDKIKMSATRAIGNLLRLITAENLQRNVQLKKLAETGLERLEDCACKCSNMKIRWNACYAIGNAMKNYVLYTALVGWQKRVLLSLCTLAQECKNLKVRITAATALRSPATRAHYAELLTSVWGRVMAAMDSAAHVDHFTEYRHKDNLVEQLCVTLAHLCCLLKDIDLPDILDALSFHYDCAKLLLAQLGHMLPPEHDSCLAILQAAKYVTVSLTAHTDSQRQALAMLQELFVWET